MLAARMVAPGQFEVDEVPVPVPGDGEVLVRMALSSICGSDLHVVYGPFQPERFPGPAGSPGHEGVGFVEESRSPQFRPGDAVLTVPHLGRMTCFAEYHLAESWALVKLGPDAELSSVLMAQQLGTVVFALRRFWPQSAGRSVTVLGAGSAGQFFVQLLKRQGFEIVVVSDPIPARRETVRMLGADHVVDPTVVSVAEVSDEVTKGRGPDLVIEAAGTELARRQAVECAAQQGRVGLFGYAERPGTEQFPYAEAWRKSLGMVLSANTQLEPGLASFREAVRLITHGEIPVSHLTANQPWPLHKIQDGFAVAREYRVNKVVFDVAR